MITSPLLDPDGRLLPNWGFLAFHEALRRDAARFPKALAGLPDDSAERSEQAAALREHWECYHGLLVFHHENEDAFLLPMIRDIAPALVPLVDDVAGQHVEIDDVLVRIDQSLSRLLVTGDAHEAMAAFDDLASLLEPHLATEEEHMVPVVVAHLTAQAAAGGEGPTPRSDGDDLDFGPTPVSFGLPWIVDGLEAEVVDLVLATLPIARRREYPLLVRAYDESLGRWHHAS
jgi:hypothetical protein